MRNRCGTAASQWETASKSPKIAKYPVNFPVSREFSTRDQFVSDCTHHHPVFPNRRNRRRLEIGRFCGDIRRPRCGLPVSVDICGLSSRFLASCLCIQKFRSRRLGIEPQPAGRRSGIGSRRKRKRRFELCPDLLRIQAECFELSAPFGGSIAKTLDTNTSG
jgi:hypothetical protein